MLGATGRVHDRRRLDLHEQVGIDQPCDLDHAGRRTDVAEDLAVGRADRLPVVDVGDEQSGTNDVLDRRIGCFERAFDVREGLKGLCVRIVRPDDLAVLVGGGRPRDVDLSPGTNGTRVSDP